MVRHSELSGAQAIEIEKAQLDVDSNKPLSGQFSYILPRSTGCQANSTFSCTL